MGLINPVAEFVVKEHCFRPINGDVLFIGRQTVVLTPTTLYRLLSRNGLTNSCSEPPELDRDTILAKGHNFITDRYFMRSLGVQTFSSLDVTDYENPDIVHDLGYPIGREYHEKFDFIFNGSCFDNMFNPGVALVNLSKMLRPRGRMLCIESACNFNGPYLMFSPGWFYDFFVINGYSDCRVYCAAFKDNNQLIVGPMEFQLVNFSVIPSGVVPPAVNGVNWFLIVIAEKGMKSTDEVQPVQLQYRNENAHQVYLTNEAVFKRNTRPMVPIGEKVLSHSDRQYLLPVGEFGRDLIPEDTFNIQIFSHAWQCENLYSRAFLIPSSGWYEDGWVDRTSRIVMPGGIGGCLTVRGMIPLVENQEYCTTIEIRIDGAPIAASEFGIGDFEINADIASSDQPRTLELLFSADQAAALARSSTSWCAYPWGRHALGLMELSATNKRGNAFYMCTFKYIISLVS